MTLFQTLNLFKLFNVRLCQRVIDTKQDAHHCTQHDT